MSGLESFVVDSQHCAALFRLGRDVEAGLAMIDLIAAVQPYFDLAPQASQQQWVLMLGHLLECQEAQNWLALSDYLEYELVRLLRDALSI